MTHEQSGSDDRIAANLPPYVREEGSSTLRSINGEFGSLDGALAAASEGSWRALGLMKVRDAELGGALAELFGKVREAGETVTGVRVELTSILKDVAGYYGWRYAAYSGDLEIATLDVESTTRDIRTAAFEPDDWAAEIRQYEAYCETLAAQLPIPETS